MLVVAVNQLNCGLVYKRIQITSLWKRAARNKPGDVQTVQTQKLIQPLLYRVCWSIADGLVEGDLVERASCEQTESQQSER